MRRPGLRRWRVPPWIWLTFLVLALFAGPQHLHAARLYVVAIGIQDYRNPDLASVLFGDKDALRFAQSLPGSVNIESILLPGPKAGRARMRSAVELALTKAGPDDAVCLFLSARGITEERTNKGFILAYDSAPGNYVGSALSVEDLKNLMLANRSAGSIFLFADLTRLTAGKPKPIHTRLSELAARDAVGRVSGAFWPASRTNGRWQTSSAGVISPMRSSKPLHGSKPTSAAIIRIWFPSSKTV